MNEHFLEFLANFFCGKITDFFTIDYRNALTLIVGSILLYTLLKPDLILKKSLADFKYFFIQGFPLPSTKAMQRHIKNVEAKLNSQQQHQQQQQAQQQQQQEQQAHQEQEQQQQQQNQQQRFDPQMSNASIIHQVGYLFFLLVYFIKTYF